MTVERRIVVSPYDIKAVVLECIRCESRVSIPPDKFTFIPEMCPHGHAWQPHLGANCAGSAPKALAESLKVLRDRIYENIGFKVFLEFEEPTSAK